MPVVTLVLAGRAVTEPGSAASETPIQQSGVLALGSTEVRTRLTPAWRYSSPGSVTASRADLATREQQIAVASRVTYDAWPNC